MFDLTRMRFSLKQLLVAMTLAAIVVCFLDSWLLGLTVVQVALPTMIGVFARLFREFLPSDFIPWLATGMLVASIATISLFMVKQYGFTEEVAIIHVCYFVFWVPQLALMAALVRRTN